MNLSNIVPNFTRPQAERGLIIGQTGSGKTYLAEKVCSFAKNIVVLDTKGLIDWKGYEVFKAKIDGKTANDSKIFDKLINSTKQRLLFKPSSKWLKDDSAIEEFFSWIYWRENCLLYVDEATTITDSHYIPQSYFDCYVRGREKGISVITSSQRPRKISKELLTEAEHWYCFYLKNFDDRKAVFQDSGIEPESIHNLSKYYFIYSGNGETYSPRKLTNKGKV